MSVFVSGEMGIVKYIGATEFAEGTWLGVQLKKPSKQNFTCLLASTVGIFLWCKTLCIICMKLQGVKNFFLLLFYLSSKKMMT